jgi:hypothetical protein
MFLPFSGAKRLRFSRRFWDLADRARVFAVAGTVLVFLAFDFPALSRPRTRVFFDAKNHQTGPMGI